MSAINRIESSISRMICFQPLYGNIFLSLNKRSSKDVPTMGVGVIRKVDLALFFNPDFVDTLSDSELVAVLKHEALHVLLHHIDRAKKFSFSPKLFNIAADMSINCHISGLPDGAIYPMDYGFSNGESSDYYYRKIKSDPNMSEQMALLETLDHHEFWEDLDSEIVGEKIREMARKAIEAQSQQGWGNIPGKLVSEIISRNTPTVNWKREIRYFINKLVVIGKESTRNRPNRRTGETHPFLNPGKKRKYTSRLLVSFDTSGSVSDEELQSFASELAGLIDHVMCDFVCFDTIVQGEPVEYSRRNKKVQIKGRGGTCFSPIINMAEERGYDGLIIFTDGDAPIPPKPKVRVLWALNNKDSSKDFPYGKKTIVGN